VEPPDGPGAGIGVFNAVDLAVRAARQAHTQLMNLSLRKREEIIASIRAKMMAHAEELAHQAYEETGLGRAEDKVLKNRLVTEKTPGTEVLKPQAYTGDRGLTLMERAPYGVIGAITPCTNPTSTIICNTIGMVAAGNAVVFNAHPAAKRVSIYAIELLNQAITAAGGPANLVTTLAEPTITTAQELMRHPGVQLLVVTGGAEVVKAAMTSGKRAICAGPGNPPVVVDESADIENAARSIVQGAALDNNIVCVLEKEIFVVDGVADQLVAALSRHGAVILKPHEVEHLEKVIFKEIRGQRQPAVVNKELIGKPVQQILSKIGITVDDRIRLAVAPVPVGHPLVWTEQMMPVIPLVRVPNVDQGIDLAREAEHGFGHTAIMHSKNLDHLSRMARVMDCSIFVKNGPSLAGLGYGGEGYCSFTIASPTGEGLTHPISFTRERRCVLVDHFRIV
jgi:acyl-CoA reductase-like NAD-dependent aldehyde dehydrogenase